MVQADAARGAKTADELARMKADELAHAKADELAASATARITDVVNGVAKFGRGPGGRPGPAPTTAAPTTTTS